jgi:hypothetical protein
MGFEMEDVGRSANLKIGRRVGLIYKESCLVNCDGWGFGFAQALVWA